MQHARYGAGALGPLGAREFLEPVVRQIVASQLQVPSGWLTPGISFAQDLATTVADLTQLVVSIERELAAGTLHRPVVADLMVRRQLKLISHPARYCSRAAEAFRREVLPVFASPDSPLRQGGPGRSEGPAVAPATPAAAAVPPRVETAQN